MRIQSLILGLSAATLLAACGGASDEPMTPAELMVGEWDQQTPFTMSAAGQTFTISGGEAEYSADGTGEIEAMLTVEGLPTDANTFEIEIGTTYVLSGDQLTETFTSAEVEGGSDAARNAIAEALRGAGPTTSTVVSITEDTLVRNVPGIGELRYTKDD